MEVALTLLLKQHPPPTVAAVRHLVQPPSPVVLPDVTTPLLDGGMYSHLPVTAGLMSARSAALQAMLHIRKRPPVADAGAVTGPAHGRSAAGQGGG